jgi:hypothetical protein
VAEVAIEGDRNFVTRTAANAESGVGGVGRLILPESWIIDAKVDRVRPIQAQGRNQWVISIQNEAGGIWQVLQTIAPGLMNEVNLTVAVELVAKDVREQDDSRVQLRGGGGERGFIYLEQANISHWLAVERRLAHDCAHQTRDQVGAGPVVEWAQAAALQQMGDQARGGGLTVRSGDDNRAVPQAAYNGRQCIGVDPWDKVA